MHHINKATTVTTSSNQIFNLSAHQIVSNGTITDNILAPTTPASSTNKPNNNNNNNNHRISNRIDGSNPSNVNNMKEILVSTGQTSDTHSFVNTNTTNSRNETNSCTESITTSNTIDTKHDDAENLNKNAKAAEKPQSNENTNEMNVDEETEPEPEIDIVINNVVCSFSVRCHLNLREIALNGKNVEFRRENGMVTMKLRRPYTTASIWSSGRITCTGATSEDQVNRNC